MLTPLALLYFAKKYPGEVVKRGPAVERLTNAKIADLKSVNLMVNRSIKPLLDKKGQDVWTLKPERGDCDDHVVTKRHFLIARGLSPSALRMVTCVTPKGESHLVLVVKTDLGDFVLDNLTDQIKDKRNVRYRWVGTSTEDPMVWTPLS